MPRVADQLLSCAFYLYENEEAASVGKSAGGTGFLVGVSSDYAPLGHHMYCVTTQHVMQSSPVVRLNTIDGGTKIFPFDSVDWDPHPDGDDIAVIPLMRGDKFKDAIEVTFFSEDLFVSQEMLIRMNIGIGDDVFMIGRFMPHDGALRNQPSLRFGHISMMPDQHHKINQVERGNFRQESYCIDMHSVFGYSGSPVFMYRPQTISVNDPKVVFRFLGIHWGSIWDTVKDKECGKQIHTHAGINGVVPAWKLWGLLQMPKFVKQREQELKDFLQRHPGDG